MKKFNKTHIFLLFALYGLSIIIISFSLSYWQMKKNLHEDFVFASKTELANQKHILIDWLEHYKQELNVLSHSRLIQNYIQHSDSKKSTMRSLYDMVQAHKNMMQLRYIDNQGNEIIRIQREHFQSHVSIVPKKALQNKKDSYYFKEIYKLYPNTIWFSDIDLNKEHGKLEVPYVPTLRVGTPIFVNKKRRGMIIINLFMENFLRELQFKGSYNLYLVDNMGQIILHPDRSLNWSKYLKRNFSLKNIFPKKAQHILDDSNYTSDNIFSQEIFLGMDKRYILIAEINEESLNNKYNELVKSFLTLAFFILIFTFPFAYIIVKHIDSLYVRLHAVLNNLGDGVFVLDKNEKIIYTNKKAENILEYSSQELMHHEFHNKIQHADTDGSFLPKELCPILNVQYTGRAHYSDKHMFTTKNGRHINVEYTATPLLIANKYQGSITSFKDITPRITLENDLLVARKNLEVERNLFIKGPVVAFTWLNNQKYSVEYVSSNVFHIFGYNKNAFTSGMLDYTSCVHPLDLNRVINELENALKEKLNAFTHEPYRIINKDGSIRWIYDRTILKKDSHTNIKHLHSFIIDITEQKKVENQLQASEEKYRLLVENASTGIFKCQQNFHLFYANKSLLSILEFHSEDALYESGFQALFVSLKEQEVFETTLTENKEVSNYKLRLRTSQGTIKELLLNAQNDGQDISGMLIDMTAIVKAEKEIQKLSTVIEQIDDLVTITDVHGVIIYVNDAFCKFTGYSKEETLGNTPSLYKSSKHTKKEISKLWETILNKQVFRSVVINKKKNNELFYEQKTITPLLDEVGEITAFVSTGKDITKTIEMQQELERLAATDHLTQLYNRLKFEELFDAELARAQRYEHPLSLIMLDIDYFKKINDTFGHDIGDSVLIQLSQLLRTEIRSTDIIARWGGEEFMILTPESAIDTASQLAEKLREKIESFDFDHVKKISCSFGVTQRIENENFHAIAQRVDIGLYDAKQRGRNCVTVI